MTYVKNDNHPSHCMPLHGKHGVVSELLLLSLECS